jgi:hypothetical protein
MNCNSCGAGLPPGATFCTNCGSPTPYNVSQPGGPAQYNPPFPGPSYGPAGGDQPQVDPTILSSPPPPPTSYNAPVYGAPPPPQYPPYQANQYGPGWQPGAFGAPQPPKKRSRLGLILGIVGGVLLLLCVGTGLTIYFVTKGAVSSVSATVTASSGTITSSDSSANATATSAVATITAVTNGITPTTSLGGAPSGNIVDPGAASDLTTPSMASAVDKNYLPTKVTTTFKTGQTIYATFGISKSAGNGYIRDKWYSNGTYAFSNGTLKVSAGFAGYMAARYDTATLGSVEIYWCTSKDCADAKLAVVMNFSVSPTGMRGSSQPVVLGRDIKQPD